MLVQEFLKGNELVHREGIRENNNTPNTPDPPDPVDYGAGDASKGAVRGCSSLFLRILPFSTYLTPYQQY